MKNRLTSRPPQVLIMLNTSTTTHLDIMRGILQFTKQGATWSTDIRTGRNDELTKIDFKKNKPDGIIADWIPASARKFLTRTGIPIVLTECSINGANVICSFNCDNKSIAELAATHLTELGFSNFAYLPCQSRQPWSTERATYFGQALRKLKKAKPFIFDKKLEVLSDWLLRLPKPVGLFAANDIHARQAIDALNSVGIKIPSEVSIIGVDNDEILCETIRPSLTSIHLNTREIGFKCAKALNAAIISPSSCRSPLKLHYSGQQVIIRNSTQMISAHDILIDRCLELMAANLSGSFSISDLLPMLHISRKTLETRFKAVTGYTPSRQLYLMRVSKAKGLLQSGKMPQSQIAETCGFCDSSHMNSVFRRLLGALPSSFRTAH